jgi:hypothetical protein
MTVINPVKATSTMKMTVDPMSIILIVIGGGIWDAVFADWLLFYWDGGFMADIPGGPFFVFSIKSFTGFFIAYLSIRYVKLEWGDEPNADFRVVLCYFIVRRWERGSRNRVWLAIYNGLADTLQSGGVLPPSTKELYIP